MTGDFERMATRLAQDAWQNSRWHRQDCINRIPSEQPVPAFLQKLSAADPAGR